MNSNIPVLTALDLHKMASSHHSGITNFPVSLVNDHVIRMSIMTEDFRWHHHPNSDETFLVIEGAIYIDLEDKTIELTVGQLFTIPSNTRHCTRPKDGRSVNVTFEKADMQTIFDQ